ncbi:MAG: hypothetical protein ABS96_29275 [Lysobacteraceae bacterium SCN 69-123]|nr:MAG: hypothetical protein ABS96_29275 [Xanthomonadaceae bacterium SCN 69-123]
MTAASLIIAIALAKLLLGILVARQGNATGTSPSSRADTDDEEGLTHLLRGQQFDDLPTGNLPSEDYSTAAGSRQAFGDFRDLDD